LFLLFGHAVRWLRLNGGYPKRGNEENLSLTPVQSRNLSNPVFPPSPVWSTGVFLGRPIPRGGPRLMPAYPAGPTRVVLARPRRHHRRLVVDLPPPDAGVEHPRRLPNTLLVWTTMVAAHRGGRTGAGFLRGFTPVDTTQRGWISTGVPCWFRGRHPRWTPTRVGRVTTRVGRLTPWVGVTHPARKTYLATRWRRRRV